MDLDEDKKGEQIDAILMEKEQKTECDGNCFLDTRIQIGSNNSLEIKHVPPDEHFTTFQEKLSIYISRIYQEKQKLLNMGFIFISAQQIRLQRKWNNRWSSAQKFTTNKLDSEQMEICTEI